MLYRSIFYCHKGITFADIYEDDYADIYEDVYADIYEGSMLIFTRGLCAIYEASMRHLRGRL